MGLSSELISQFVKAVKTDSEKPTETTVYGTIKVSDKKEYVQIDGSTMLTPIASSSSTTAFEDGDRVTVMIKNHSAVVTGNLTQPSATKNSVDKVSKDIADNILNFDILIGDTLDVISADIEDLKVDILDVKMVEVNGELKAESAVIKALLATSGKFDSVATDLLEVSFVNVGGRLVAQSAKVENLEAAMADFRALEADYLYADDGTFKCLTTDHLYASDGSIKFANIDFSNITEAAMEYLYASSGLIEDVIVSNGTVTGSLIGVTIKGDIVEAGTVVADKLVIRGDDGLYYKLNFEAGEFLEGEPIPTDSLHGSVITAKSITAEKVSVDDLVAFDATIGGFNITENSIYSGVKASEDNTTRGVYMDTDGQFNFGDADNFIRYHKTTDEEGNEVYRLEISADSLLFGSGSKSSIADLEALAEHIKMGTYTDPDTGEVEPSLELSEGDTNFKQVITNTKTMFMDGSVRKTQVDKDGITTENVSVSGEIRQSEWVWKKRANGNYGLIWKEVID